MGSRAQLCLLRANSEMFAGVDGVDGPVDCACLFGVIAGISDDSCLIDSRVCFSLSRT